MQEKFDLSKYLRVITLLQRRDPTFSEEINFRKDTFSKANFPFIFFWQDNLGMRNF